MACRNADLGRLRAHKREALLVATENELQKVRTRIEKGSLAGQDNMGVRVGVAIKSEEQQSVLMVHRARTLVVANRTAQVNQIRGLLGEFGLVVPKGVARLRRELPGILEDAENGLPDLARQVLAGLLDQFHDFDTRIAAYDRQIRVLAAASEPAGRLMQIEAIGAQTATALVASMGDPPMSLTAAAATQPRSDSTTAILERRQRAARPDHPPG